MPSAPTADSGATGELGIDISAGQVNRLLMEINSRSGQQEVLQAGLETAEYVHTDDTGARHRGRMGIAP